MYSFYHNFYVLFLFQQSLIVEKFIDNFLIKKTFCQWMSRHNVRKISSPQPTWAQGQVRALDRCKTYWLPEFINQPNLFLWWGLLKLFFDEELSANKLLELTSKQNFGDREKTIVSLQRKYWRKYQSFFFCKNLNYF